MKLSLKSSNVIRLPHLSQGHDDVLLSLDGGLNETPALLILVGDVMARKQDETLVK